MSEMRRREFITLLGSGAAVPAMLWPLAARAQEPQRMRRIGVLMTTAADDPEGQARIAAFLQGLQQLGWTDGRNVRIETRWAAGDPERIRKYAAELAALAPNVILAPGGASAAPLLQATRAVPIVFVHVPDPVGAGFVDSLARPGGNATGFTAYEYGISGKWLELLKEIAPGVTRAAIVRDPAIASGTGQWGAIQTAAPSIGVEVSPVNVRDAGEIERAVTAFARSWKGGLVVTGSALAIVHRDLIITLAARHKLPAVYFERFFVTGGGLISYGPNLVDQYRRAVGYVDRILKGEKPADLPVQAPVKYELAVNLKTAKALGLDVPPDSARARRRGARVSAHVKRREFITPLGGAAAVSSLSWPLAARAKQPERMRRIGRREFIALLGGAAAAWPLAARAQQPAMPVIGYLSSQSPDAVADLLRAFRQGLKETGYVEGENLMIEYRWAENQADRLPVLATELVRRRVAVIAASGSPASASAAKATTTIPVVFMVPEDPVRLGLVASLARPGGNMTGVNFFSAELAAKRLELLRELVPAVTRVAVLLNPAEATIAASNLRDVETAARAMGLQIRLLNATTSREIDAAFATLARERPDALFVSSGPFFTSRRVQLAHHATRHAVPAIHGSRLYPEVGGLISYGASVADAQRQAGVYAGRIVRGAKPAELPVVQSTKFELVINHQTARMLGIEVPATLLARADEVIE